MNIKNNKYFIILFDIYRVLLHG